MRDDLNYDLQPASMLIFFPLHLQDYEIGNYMLQQNVGGHPVSVFRFPARAKFPARDTVTVWSGSNDHKLHQPPADYVYKELPKWGTGPECTSILCKANGQVLERHRYHYWAEYNFKVHQLCCFYNALYKSH